MRQSARRARRDARVDWPLSAACQRIHAWKYIYVDMVIYLLTVTPFWYFLIHCKKILYHKAIKRLCYKAAKFWNSVTRLGTRSLTLGFDLKIDVVSTRILELDSKHRWQSNYKEKITNFLHLPSKISKLRRFLQKK